MAGSGWFLRIRGLPSWRHHLNPERTSNLRDTRGNLSRQGSIILGENNQIPVGMSPDFTHQPSCMTQGNKVGRTHIYPQHPVRT